MQQGFDYGLGTGDLTHPEHFDPDGGALMVFASLLILVSTLVVALVRLLNDMRRHRSALRAEAASSLLREGVAVLYGAATPSQDDGDNREPMAAIHLQQIGSEYNNDDDQPFIAWTEVERRTTARPFYLQMADRSRVRVEPPDDPDRVILIDDLDETRRTGLDRRERSAVLTDGENVYVSGVLSRVVDPQAGAGRGYRDAALGWALRAPSNRPMLLSTRSLSSDHSIGMHALFVALTIAVLFVAHPLALSDYHALRRSGVADVLQVERARTQESRDDEGRPQYSYFAHGRLQLDRAPIELPISSHLHQALTRRLTQTRATRPDATLPLQVLRLRETPRSDTVVPGTRATPSIGVTIFAFIITMLLLVAYAVTAWARRPWYRKEVHEQEQGTLADTFKP